MAAKINTITEKKIIVKYILQIGIWNDNCGLISGYYWLKMLLNVLPKWTFSIAIAHHLSKYAGISCNVFADSNYTNILALNPSLEFQILVKCEALLGSEKSSTAPLRERARRLH